MKAATSGDERSRAINPLQRIPPHTVRHEVLPPDELAALLAWTLANEDALVASKVGAHHVYSEKRNARSLYGPAPWKAGTSERIAALVPGILADLGMASFEMSRFEIEMVVYPDGGFIGRHHDTATGSARHKRDRVVTIVYYFHREPKGYSGGELRLSPRLAPPEGEPQHVDLAPGQNMLIAFPSWALHEVLPIRIPSGDYADSRFAINFWAQREVPE
ncbi:2OG-Fe(II) oxygenase [Sphingomonas sp. AOB5]|uniref:2OG-Fe(II) oxygenase n=1 Tax=Sphingomonas sp. AOB5 TaxID=3034017 RepID=UPI0023F62166|nr:2OG-Fe(II) oxygenase [Sphingomonas sp. AOB5]MDF7777929.1 2OG-Fe(II) oxygenase [Sphingomonas sp. AOB5]